MRQRISDGLELGGALAAVVGVGPVAGVGAALIVGGVLAVAFGLALELRRR